MTDLERMGVELARLLIHSEDESPETGDDYIGGAALSRLRDAADDLLREAARTAKPHELAR